MITATKFSLYGFVREVYTETGEIDPDKLTQAVVSALSIASEEDQHAALEQALRSFCQHVLNSVRHIDFPGGQMSPDAQARGAAGGPTPNSARSWKNGTVETPWQSKLERPFPAYDESPWVRFGDMTVTILDRTAAFHTKLADANRAKAVEMAEWAELLREHKVATIRELPESVLRERLS